MKSRRDITLGEMQDECKKRGRCRAIDKVVDKCPYASICIDTMAHCEEACDGSEYDVFTNPCDWNLTDPPRFNEAQMALLKAWRDAGAMAAQLTHDVAGMDSIFFYSFSKPLQIEYCMGFVKNSKVLVGLDFNGEILDIAELIGKESNER